MLGFSISTFILVFTIRRLSELLRQASDDTGELAQWGKTFKVSHNGKKLKAWAMATVTMLTPQRACEPLADRVGLFAIIRQFQLSRSLFRSRDPGEWIQTNPQRKVFTLDLILGFVTQLLSGVGFQRASADWFPVHTGFCM